MFCTLYFSVALCHSGVSLYSGSTNWTRLDYSYEPELVKYAGLGLSEEQTETPSPATAPTQKELQ